MSAARADLWKIRNPAGGSQPLVVPAGRIAVDIRFAQLEPDAAIETICRVTGGARAQLDGARAAGERDADGVPVQRFANALTAGGRIDDHVLNPGADAGRNAEGRQGEHADNARILTRH